MRRRRQIKRIDLPEISLTPLIDVALTLLVIFMLTTPMMQTSLDIKLPKGKGNSSSQVDKSIEISIDKSGLIYLNEKVVNKSNLKQELEKTIDSNTTLATVRADGAVIYDNVANVLDILNGFSGIKVSLILQREV